jgi:hypothetical protein
VAIGKSMAARLGDRRWFNADGGPRVDSIVQDFAHSGGDKTCDLAAEHAGFGNHETYRQAEAGLLIMGGLR